MTAKELPRIEEIRLPTLLQIAHVFRQAVQLVRRRERSKRARRQAAGWERSLIPKALGAPHAWTFPVRLRGEDPHFSNGGAAILRKDSVSRDPVSSERRLPPALGNPFDTRVVDTTLAVEA
jgi:hypothetical protein